MATIRALPFHAVVTRVLFITGTDTNAGKTVFTYLLTRHLISLGFEVAALKPFCSGGRGDAELLHSLQNRALTLDDINPWHFDAPLTPMLAARLDNTRVSKSEVLRHVRKIQRRFPLVLVEGAGGLLSPLAASYDAPELIDALGAIPLVVCMNRLGVINHARLTMAALPTSTVRSAQIILTESRTEDASQLTNAHILAEYFGSKRVHVLPRTRWKQRHLDPHVQKMLCALVNRLNLQP